MVKQTRVLLLGAAVGGHDGVLQVLAAAEQRQAYFKQMPCMTVQLGDYWPGATTACMK